MRESARDPLGLVTDRLRTANPELAQAYDLWTAHLAAPPTIDELLRTADHSRPAMPEPSRDRVEAYRTPVRVGGASLTLSTRAPWRTELIVSTAFAVLHPFEGILAEFLYCWLRTSHFVSFVEARQKGISYPAINDGDLLEALVPVPPTQEQERIVTKVNELLTLCDQLEQQTQHREAIAEQFATSASQHLSN